MGLDAWIVRERSVRISDPVIAGACQLQSRLNSPGDCVRLPHGEPNYRLGSYDFKASRPLFKHQPCSRQHRFDADQTERFVVGPKNREIGSGIGRNHVIEITQVLNERNIEASWRLSSHSQNEMGRECAHCLNYRAETFAPVARGGKQKDRFIRGKPQFAAHSVTYIRIFRGMED